MAAPDLTFAAILAAGGRGTRLSAGSGSSVPKQFLQLRGCPIYVWSLKALLAVPSISRAVMVVPPEMVPMVEESLGALPESFSGKPIQIVAGGDTRQKSVFNGLQALTAHKPDYVLVHDAARPFLTDEILERVLSGVTTFGACTSGVAPADTIKRVEGPVVAQTLNRDELLLVQTPQAAKFSWLINAHEQAEQAGTVTTDDAAILELAGHKVGIVRGATYNVKITQPEDLILAEALASIVFADRL